VPTTRPAELKIISEKLVDFFEETVTEPLPKRFVELIQALNERERRWDDGNASREEKRF
jgi:hypothetical protein